MVVDTMILEAVDEQHKLKGVPPTPAPLAIRSKG
jgi:hypothetical protein